ncbi:MAG: PDDEXK nuclease domain-containing protein [Patulibacter sp.]
MGETTNADLAGDDGYAGLLAAVREIAGEAQVRAAVGSHMVRLTMYWNIGREILVRQEETGAGSRGYGARVIERLAADLAADPALKSIGASKRNLQYMRRFAAAWPDWEKVQPAVALSSWKHQTILLDRLDNPELRLRYAHWSAEHGWSANTLALQIENERHLSVGAAPTSFALTMPAAEAEFAQEVFRDEYTLGFIGDLGDVHREADLERRLIERMRDFLLELGVGFAWVGSQKALVVDGDEFRLDLLFFHTRLNRFVVFELKTGRFHPKDAGQAAFYAALIDRQERAEQHGHGETIGVVLCRDYSETVAEIALSRSSSPLVVSRYRLNAPSEQQGNLPADLSSELPDPVALAEQYARVVVEETHRLDHHTAAEDE